MRSPGSWRSEEAALEMGGNVLVIDGAPENLDFLAGTLGGNGYMVRTASDGPSALEALGTFRPDLVLMDMTTPGADGCSFWRRWREGEKTRDLPIIFLHRPDGDAARSAGAVDFIPRPLRAEEVLARVRTQLELRRLRHGYEEQKAELEREVARRKKTEHALREILDNSPAVIYVKDTEGRYTLINRTFEELFHVGRDYFIGKTDHDVFNREVADALHLNDRLVIETGRALQVEELVIHDDGPHSYISVKFPLRDVHGRTYAICGISSDITVRKQAELVLRQAKEDAEAANRAKSVFLANMSHELRTPLNVILGFSQLMQRDAAVSESSRRHLDTINRSGAHLLALINDVLEVSKIETGCVTLNPTNFDLYGLLQDIEAMFRMRAEEKGLRFRLDRPKNLPRFLVGDQRKLRQVLINLLGNAVKFTDEGGIRLHVSVSHGPCCVDAVKQFGLLFEVEDTGAGIAPEEMNKLFQPFEQTLSGKTKGGSGLGLTISREYASLMGCDLKVRSEPGKGSIFSFCGRFDEGQKELVEKIENARRVAGLAPNSGSKKILVVDDKAESRRFVVELLNLAGFGTLEAGNGEEALAVFEAEAPDLILMDMRMPVMDGYEATRRLKATAAGKRTPIIAVSASALEEEREKILNTGADELIRKPFRENELFERIGKCLGIEYCYAEEKKRSPGSEETGKISSADLKNVPFECREKLRQGLVALDVEVIREAIDRISVSDRKVGRIMRRLEKGYQFEMLLDMLQQQS